jgi:hypothetical protein
MSSENWRSLSLRRVNKVSELLIIAQSFIGQDPIAILFPDTDEEVVTSIGNDGGLQSRIKSLMKRGKSCEVEQQALQLLEEEISDFEREMGLDNLSRTE